MSFGQHLGGNACHVHSDIWILGNFFANLYLQPFTMTAVGKVLAQFQDLE
jgi:hypothetical protein